MTTFWDAAWACGAVALIAVTMTRAAKTPVSADRSFLADARWAPFSLSGNRLASSLPERRAWGRATVGVVAVGGRHGAAGGGASETAGRGDVDRRDDPGPGGGPPEGGATGACP